MPHPPVPGRPPARPLVALGPIAAPHLPAELRSELPLHGLTVLAVEDSRFACEALRLLCRRAGARLRRAETIEAARAHLRVYLPDVVIIDLGLPDGRGEALIRDLICAARRPGVVLGTSGNPDGRASALAAGADGFLEKPFESLAQFCAALRRHFPELDITAPPGVEDAVVPDPLALRDDLAHAAARLATDPDPEARRYVVGFLRGLARHAHDSALAQAVEDMQAGGDGAGGSDLDPVRRLVNRRRCETGQAFAASTDTAAV